MRILFTGGGTGGHIFPIIAVARQLKKLAREREMDLELFYLGPADFDLQPLKAEEIKIKAILAGKLRRYFSGWTILDIFKIPIGLFQVLIYLYTWMPRVIFSKGGYGSVPIVLVGWLFRIPILVHESDTIPGLANRLAGKLASRVAVSFEAAKKYFPAKKTALIGNPVRQEILQADREEAKKIFKLVSDQPVILIFGGSQGAQAINQIILDVLPSLLEKAEIIHICGPKNYSQISSQTSSIVQTKELLEQYHLYPFLYENQIKHAYAIADLVISRAGAGSIFEIAACGKPSILIPLPSAASNHQRENAFAYAKSGTTIVIEQANLTPHLFLERIFNLLEHAELRQKMSQCALAFAKPEAGQKIAEELVEMGSE